MNPFWMIRADLRRTLGAALGILVLLSFALSASMTVSFFDHGLREAGASSAQDSDLVIGAPGSRLDLVLATVFLRTDEVLPLLEGEWIETLEADPRVAALSPLVFSDHWKGFPLVGVGPEFSQIRSSLKVSEGRWPQKPFEVLAGSGTGLALGSEFHGSHGNHDADGPEEEIHHEATYVVVGLFETAGTPWDRALVTPAESLWEIHEHGDGLEAQEDRGDHEHGDVSAILVKPKDFASAYSLRAQFREGATTAAFPGEVLAGLFGLFDRVKDLVSLVLNVFQGLVFAAALLSLLALLPSKARWIGLLRALGAGPGYVFVTLWFQTAVLFLGATLVGGLVGWTLAGALATALSAQTGLTVAITWTGAEVLQLALFVSFGLVGALIPALVGYRVSVRQSLLGQ